EPSSGDMIPTRILTLDGLEPGVNRGPGHDSLERYIYIHGTNHEAAIGTAASHGCVRMLNADVVTLFERLRDGDYVVVMGEAGAPAPGASDHESRAATEPPPIPDPRGAGRFHYAGLGGSGMSAL